MADPTRAGQYTVTATLNNPDYTATAVTGTLVIGQATPTITWAVPGSIDAGTPLGAAQLDAIASFDGLPLPGVLIYSPPAGTILPTGNGQTLIVSFTPTDGTDFKAVTSSVPIDVLPQSVPQPAPTPTPATIIGEQPVFRRKLNKHGNPVGKAVLTGFTLDFNTSIGATAASNPANYELDTDHDEEGQEEPRAHPAPDRGLRRRVHARERFGDARARERPDVPDGRPDRRLAGRDRRFGRRAHRDHGVHDHAGRKGAQAVVTVTEGERRSRRVGGREVLAHDVEDGIVQRAVRGEDIGPGQREGLAAAGGDPAAGLLDEQAAGGEVPGRELELEVGAEHPEPDHAEVERRGPEAADAVDLPPLQVADGLQRRLHHGAPVVVEADADERLVEAVVLGDPGPAAVLIRALAPRRDVPLVADRVEDDAALGPAPAVVGDRDGEMRDLVREVVGAVERVDDPEVLGADVARVRLLAQRPRGRGTASGSPRRSPARPRYRRRRRGWRRPCSASRCLRGSSG